jgi:hypothetical protein
MVNTRRNIRLTLAFGFGAVFVIALTGLVYFPAFGLAALGFIGVVIASSLIMARGTSGHNVWAAFTCDKTVNPPIARSSPAAVQNRFGFVAVCY